MARGNDAEERTPLLQSVVTSAPDVHHRRALGVRGAKPADYVISVFEPEHGGQSAYAADNLVDDSAFYQMVDNIRASIDEGVQPRMISVGTSGSYFVRVRERDDTRIVGVFKPMDEEPYGNLKCVTRLMQPEALIPNFSYLSEVGASFLDDRLELGLVPKTRLVGLASPSFHYLYRDRRRYERGQAPLPSKIGSLQQFLVGYENASQFLRRHSLPGRPRDLFERDLSEENAAHRLSRRKERARLRMCFIAIKRLILCRYGPGPYGSPEADECEQREAPPAMQLDHEAQAYPAAAPMTTGTRRDTFQWTARTWREFRLELEKLVVLDFLMRNTDRGLDNFMVTYDPNAGPDERSIRIGAIDNSLAFPHQHPRGLRDYPYGWLFLPTNLIGDAFSDETRKLFLPKLTDPVWWATTIDGLRRIFSQDAHFHERVFQDQMDVFRGQGYVLAQCLQNKDQGPIELCALPKQLVRQSIRIVFPSELRKHTVADLSKGRTSKVDERQEQGAAPLAIPTPRGQLSQRPGIAHSMPSDAKPSDSAEAPEPLAIEVVERINQLTKRTIQRSITPPPNAMARPLASRAASTAVLPDTRPHNVSQQMHSLDLAGSDTPPADAEDPTLPPVPVPVLVERLETETRRPWIWWY